MNNDLEINKNKAKGYYGKTFEEEVKKDLLSIDQCFYQRLKDDTMNYKNASNICDCIVFYNKRLYLLELKATKGKSLPLANIKKEQIEGITKESSKKGIVGGFLVKFYNIDENKVISEQEVYFLDITVFNTYFEENPTKKSVPIEYIRKHGIKVEQKRKRVKFTYNMLDLLNSIGGN